MSFPPNLRIAQSASLKPLGDIAAAMGIGPHLMEPYGEHVAKIKLAAIDELADRPRAKYVVVSAVTPTPLGEGKTTTTVGLGQAFSHIGKRATVAIRQPSMGPTFGIKGGAAGGGYSQVVPMEILNLHLTGDFHAVTAAHNLLSAMLDNHLHQGNAAGPRPARHHLAARARRQRPRAAQHRRRPRRQAGRRPAPDRVRHHRRQRGDGDLRARHLAAGDARAVRAASSSATPRRATPVTAEEIGGAGAMTVIMRDALKPNLMQTLENTPVLVHAGPFGNIAHGNSSVVADRIGIHGGRLPRHRGRVRRRHGRGAVLQHQVPGVGPHAGRGRRRRHRAGAQGALRPAPDRRRASRCPTALLKENPDEVHVGGANLRKQIENIRLHGVTPVVAINAFPERPPVRARRDPPRSPPTMGARVAVCTPLRRGRPRGARSWPRRWPRPRTEPESSFRFLYPDEASLEREDRDDRDEGVRRRRRRLHHRRRPPARDLRAQRLREPAGLHREDAPVALVGPVAARRADRVAAAGARGPRLGRRRASSTRSAATCARCRASERTRTRTRSTSTRTEMSWASSSLSA